MSEKILTLIDRVGSNAYAVEVSKDGAVATAEVTAAQASKLQGLLGKDNVAMVGLRGSHVLVAVDIAALEKAVAEKSTVSRGSSVQVDITSHIHYSIDAPDAVNDVTECWWSKDSNSGAITVNGEKYAIRGDFAADHYDEPEDSDGWDPERTVYAVELPIKGIDHPITLVSYGVTNLIRRVCARTEVIG